MSANADGKSMKSKRVVKKETETTAETAKS